MRFWRRAVGGISLVGALAGAGVGTIVAQENNQDNELDRFMEQVLARRDQNRLARRQYVFDELERFTVTGYDGEVYDTSSFTG